MTGPVPLGYTVVALPARSVVDGVGEDDAVVVVEDSVVEEAPQTYDVDVTVTVALEEFVVGVLKSSQRDVIDDE